MIRVTAEPTGATLGPARQEASPPDKTPDRSSGKQQTNEQPSLRCLHCEQEGNFFGLKNKFERDEDGACARCGSVEICRLHYCDICGDKLGSRGGMRVADSETFDVHCIECIEADRSDQYAPEPTNILADGGQVVARRECIEHDLEEFRREQVTRDVELVVRKCQRCGERESEFVEGGGRR